MYRFPVGDGKLMFRLQAEKWASKELPTEYPAVPAMQYPPLPTLWTSRIRPPVPVVAPLNGATPVGKLCVSAVNIRWDSDGT